MKSITTTKASSTLELETYCLETQKRFLQEASEIEITVCHVIRTRIILLEVKPTTLHLKTQKSLLKEASEIEITQCVI